MPYVLVNSEIEACLPCSEEEWHASTFEAWKQFRNQEKKPHLMFQDALHLLLSDRQPNVAGCSPFGAVVMIYALLQHRWHSRQLCDRNAEQGRLLSIEDALAKWVTISDTGLMQSPLTNKSLPRALELDANLLFKWACFVVHADLHPSQFRLLNLETDRLIPAMKVFATNITRSAESCKASLYSIQVLLMLFNSGFVWTNKILTGVPSLQFHIISSLYCCKSLDCSSVHHIG